MSASEMRAKAAWLKDLALKSDDNGARSDLLYLAGEYEKVAELDEAVPASIAPTTFPV